MKEEEAKKYVRKNVRLILSNNFIFHGLVVSASEDTLVLLDRFQKNVSIRLNDILICEVQ